MLTELPALRRAFAMFLGGFVCLSLTGFPPAIAEDSAEKNAAVSENKEHDHDHDANPGEHPQNESKADHSDPHGADPHEGGHSMDAVLHGKLNETIHHPGGLRIKVKELADGNLEVEVKEHHPDGPIEVFADLALWSFIVFVVFVFILGKFAWGPLAAGLDQRDSMIRKNIDDAEAARLAAEKLLADHTAKLNHVQEEVREILAEARRDAEHTSQEIKATAEKEAAAARDRAVQDIQRVKDLALDELFAHFATTVTDATEHVIGRSLNAADDERLVNEAVSQFSSRQS